MDIKLCRQTADNLFSKRVSWLMLMQEIGENFFPERAEFTLRREISDEFAGDLMSSYPILTRRDLGDQTGNMLRPTAKQWFHQTVGFEEVKDIDARRWLEHQTTVQKRAMYDTRSQFTGAMKQADHDYITFGNDVVSVRLNRVRNGLLYRCYHLRDVVWMEDEDDEICFIARKWKPHAVDLKRLFGAKNHPSLDGEVRTNPFGEVECLHIMIKSELFDGDSRGRPFFSIYLDTQHGDHVLEQQSVWNREYCISRWQRVSNSQYALSPAALAALPEARLLQAMTYTLLEAGEKLTNPPMIATQNVVRSDIAIYAGGVTWVDEDYDEKLGEALRPMALDAKGMPIGIDMQKDARLMIAQAWFLNKLTLPIRGPEMTAYEVGQRIQQYIRDALPIFEPMEYERNGQICEMTFDIMFRAGGFGSPMNIPKALQGRNVTYRFESPLHDAIEEQRGQKFLEAKELVTQALTIDQNAIVELDARTALREALIGIKAPATWLRDKSEGDRMVEEKNEQMGAEQALALAQQGADAAATAGKAGIPLTAQAA